MFAYTPHFIPTSIVLIGAGGTGSRLISPLAQLVRTSISKYSPQAWIPNLPIYIIDGDKVEGKNLTRQNFIAKDVGQFKSVVLASRYANAFGVDIYPSTQFLNPSSRALDFIGKPEDLLFKFENSVVILAVDSAGARKDILKTLCLDRHYGLATTPSGSRNMFIIDAGNEDAFGQIKFFTASHIYPTLLKGGIIPRSFSKNYPMPFIPMDIRYYAELGGSAAELSCVDLPQTLAINNMMAALICSVVQNFLYLKPMTYDGIRFGLDGSTYSELNTPRRWLSRGIGDDQMPRGLDLLKGLDTIGESRGGSPLLLAVEDSLAEFKKMGLKVDSNGELIPIEAPKPPAPKLEVAEVAGEKPKKFPRKVAPKSLLGETTPTPVRAPELERITESPEIRVPENPPPLTRVDEDRDSYVPEVVEEDEGEDDELDPA